MVHIGEGEYFRGITERSRAFDETLFELITDADNTITDGTGRRALRCPLYPPEEQRNLAAQHDLQTQLDCMDLSTRGWYVTTHTPHTWMPPKM